MKDLRRYDPNLSISLRLQRMEDIFEKAKGKVDHPHRHDYYTVIWIHRGSGSHIIDFNEYALANNAVFFVSPGQIHQMITKTEPKGWVITFSKGFLQHNHIDEEFIDRINLFNSFEERPPLFLSKPSSEKLQLLFEMMEQDYQAPGEYQIGLLSAYLKIFLITCVNSCELEESKLSDDHGGKSILKTFKNLVKQNYQQMHKVSSYAELMNIAPKYLNQVVKTLLGMTAKEVIQEKIVLNAKRELKYTEKSIKEIAYGLGFDDPLYFSQFFKKCTGTSPTKFRQG